MKLIVLIEQCDQRSGVRQHDPRSSRCRFEQQFLELFPVSLESCAAAGHSRCYASLPHNQRRNRPCVNPATAGTCGAAGSRAPRLVQCEKLGCRPLSLRCSVTAISSSGGKVIVTIVRQSYWPERMELELAIHVNYTPKRSSASSTIWPVLPGAQRNCWDPCLSSGTSPVLENVERMYSASSRVMP